MSVHRADGSGLRDESLHPPIRGASCIGRARARRLDGLSFFGHQSSGQDRERFDSLVHLLDHGLKEAGDLGPRLDPQPLAVALLGQVKDFCLQLQDARVGRIVVGNRLALPAGPLRLGRLPVRPRYVLM
jgi:hypothetical protein